ncbi:DUF503 domain-containing protein [Marinobacterium arenosum]|uniref:DUF503 domain-containing protein n=1 Tax=Marinobacterium arenosum TaxID=2862496 RepID=UPI001C941D7A|nr:DUF503 domain-containing protein [Marinobacterium arenosum]MBY4678657.1 DUF503 domain-containing protein [Marinobacterium arenosum]
MVIMLMEVEFHLSGCRSLKEKRHRLLGIRDRFGKRSDIALCESGYRDLHQRAQWSFVVLGMERKQVLQALSQIEEYLCSGLDAVITRLERQEI